MERLKDEKNKIGRLVNFSRSRLEYKRVWRPANFAAAIKLDDEPIPF